MSRTGLSPRLASHTIEPYVEMHPADAETYGVEPGCLVRVENQWGEVTARARISDTQQRGSLFIPMHWSVQYAPTGRVNALLPAVTDPLSGQPEFKQGRARMRARHFAWHGFLFSRRLLEPAGAHYWARSRGNDFWRYELAGDATPEDWAGMARSYLCRHADDVGWVEYTDRAANRYRAARFEGAQLESCLFIGPDIQLPPRDWIEALFQQDALSPKERSSLLSGCPPHAKEDVGKILCACHHVGERRILRGIQEEGLDTVEAIAERLAAGSGCGSCVPEIRALLAAI